MSTSADTLYVPPRKDWLQRRTESILEPTLPIIDPHHHLWDRSDLSDEPDTGYLLHELLKDTNSGHNIVATVYMEVYQMYRASGPEPLRPVGETEFANGIAAMSASGKYGPTKVCAGIVGFADLRNGGSTREILEAHIRAGGGRFRGIRQCTPYDPDPFFTHPYPAPIARMSDEAFRQGFACLQPLNLSFDAWLYYHQVDELIALARAFPGTSICLEHTGGPLGIRSYKGKRDEVFSAWSKGVRALAECPNVVVKLGGMGMVANGWGFHTKTEPPSSRELAEAWKPFVETCIEAFGASRCMFESNFPVDKGSYSYSIFWNACKLLAKEASSAEKAALFHDTAARFYRLEA
jgi:L-fuconolactonase